MEFVDMASRAQVYRLRRFALRALERYPVEVARLRLIEHGFNTTFRVDTTAGDIFALRIDVNRQKPVDALHAEMAWIDAIANDLDLAVPAPFAASDGVLFVRDHFEPLDIDLSVAMMTWLPGKDLGDPNVDALRVLGRIAAQLHDHAASWKPPAQAVFPEVGAVMMDSPNRLFDDHPSIDDGTRELIAETFRTVTPRFDSMIAADTKRPIHADLHCWNVKWLRGRMAVFDFDDAGISVPAHDLSIAAYYFNDDETGGLRSSMFEGYEEVRPLPPFSDEQFNAALAARTLILLNDLIVSNNRELLDLVPKMIDNTVIRFRHYLETGQYVTKLPGVVRIG